MENNRIKIVEAMAFYTANYGLDVEKPLRRILWPESNDNTQRQNIVNLKTGKTKSVTKEMVEKICTICEVDPNFLFGYKVE